MYKALIIDDEYYAQEGLKKLIAHTAPNLFSNIYVAESVNQGVELIREFKPDLVFLDIHMPNEYGFKLFDYFDDINFEVIFTTAHSNYVLEAVNQWGCLGYLMKPISISDLEYVLQRFKQVYTQKNLANTVDLDASNQDDIDELNEIKTTLNQENGILLFSSVNELSFIKIDDIIYCKAADNYCEIYTSTKSFTISKPLKEIEKSICRNSFIRVHRSFLVNLEYAVRLDKRNNTLIVQNSNSDNESEILIPVTASGLKILMNAVS
ncbi:LytR/AlgR family response regulator transcription factor [Faecalibacter macacae]|uniref:DNA-binding response regulator n=1 Tax=Faecalibacter macacae TaxID=1859289 RepID=A0A3L9MBA5_9FLAO|nr:LytTR family DNA-binding domain-containing protein [Faecalibacter macacae]RLZ09873.1 DNA-binding response regulator [Faecalibacter macacae]